MCTAKWSIWVGVEVLLVDCVSGASWVQWQGNGHYYHVVQEAGAITWDSAQVAAVGAGGYLATITSAEEGEFVFSLANHPQYWSRTAYVCGPWLGGFQPTGSQEPAGGWRWVTGEPFVYTNWYPGEPNNDWGGGENHLHLSGGWGGAPSGKWNDLNQYQTTFPVSAYVVEAPVPEPATLVLLAFGAVVTTRPRTRAY